MKKRSKKLFSIVGQISVQFQQDIDPGCDAITPEDSSLPTRNRDRGASRQSGLTPELRRTGLGFVLVLGVMVGSLWLWVNDPLDLRPPKDSELMATFFEKRNVFERIVAMAQMDGEPGWRPDVKSNHNPLPEERVKAYRNLISELGSSVVVAWDHQSGNVNFVFVAGGALLAVGAEWYKGIAYIPNRREEDGELILSLDGARRLKAGAYLREIDKNWFLYYDRTE